MKAASQRILIRAFHIFSGILISVYIYSPLSEISLFGLIVKTMIIPFISISGMWMWKGHLIKKFSKKEI